MSELQLTFGRDVCINFLIIGSISNLSLGKGGLWTVGQIAFLGTGGLFALFVQSFAPSIAAALAVVVAMLCASVLGLGAIRLDGDRFVVLSLAFSYAAYVLSVAVFGLSVRGLPGPSTIQGRSAVTACLVAFCALASTWVAALDRSRAGAVLRIMRDRPEVLTVSGYSRNWLQFWLHLLSAFLPAVAGIFLVLDQTSYSPNSHSGSRGILLFAAAFPFGLNSLAGSWLAALTFATLLRLFDFLTSAASVREAITQFHPVLESGAVSSVLDGLAAPLTEITIGLLLIFFVRLRPQGLLGRETRWIRS